MQLTKMDGQITSLVLFRGSMEMGRFERHDVSPLGSGAVEETHSTPRIHQAFGGGLSAAC